MFRSGFVNIIGRPNVGKSTLMNALIGEQMSITTFKPQTTRHRIRGILNSSEFQIVFSDTPGYVVDPAYKMHEKMNRFVFGTFEDADILILLIGPGDKYEDDHPLLKAIKNSTCPKFLVINKVDLVSDQEVLFLIDSWKDRINFTEIIPISALHHNNTDTLLRLVIQHLPEGPVYFPQDQISDKPERFFISEIIREQIFLLYQQEIPYSCEVAVESFRESGDLIRIEATIFVNRKTQKSILIGKGGTAIKKLGIQARRKIENFVKKKIFLDLHVKVRENWRNNESLLDRLGYGQ
ncbi:MAG: GTPase Era [Saprospiraceae bacterium]|nr:GTPase Era [Saprospiraceae bacterium]